MRLNKNLPWPRPGLKLFVLVTVTVTLLVGLALKLAFSERALLAIQNGLDIPGEQFTMGSATFAKPKNWLLLSSRRHRDEPARMFGFVPKWLTPGEHEAPKERYLMFLARSGKEETVITFRETDSEQNRKLERLWSKLPEVSPRSNLLSWERRGFHDLAALEARSATSTTTYVPSIRVEIDMDPYLGSAEETIAMKK